MVLRWSLDCRARAMAVFSPRCLSSRKYSLTTSSKSASSGKSMRIVDDCSFAITNSLGLLRSFPPSAQAGVDGRNRSLVKSAGRKTCAANERNMSHHSQAANQMTKWMRPTHSEGANEDAARKDRSVFCVKPKALAEFPGNKRETSSASFLNGESARSKCSQRFGCLLADFCISVPFYHSFKRKSSFVAFTIARVLQTKMPIGKSIFWI